MGSSKCLESSVACSGFVVAWRSALCAASIFLAAHAVAMADSAHFEIPMQPLPTALKRFAEQAHMQLLYQFNTVDHAFGTEISGDLDKHLALDRLLKGTGLEAIYSSDNSATIRPIKLSVSTSATSENDANGGNSPAQPANFLQFAQATVGEGSSAESGRQLANQDYVSSPLTLEEVVVTARKLSERLQDVPVSITEISAQSLADQNVNTLRDLYAQIPGLTYQGGSGFNTLSLNGIASGTLSSSPTVAVTVDDIPFGAASGFAHGSQLQPDIDPSILSGIEVLRGPQGTLYGANSLGGLLKYETLTPSTTVMSGRIEVGNQFVAHDDTGYFARGSLGLPLIDGKAALQVSGFYRDDPGFIYDTLTRKPNFNSQHADGGYAALFLRPIDEVTIKLFVLEQHLRGQGGPTERLGANLQPATGDLQTPASYSPFWTNDTLYGARLAADLGFAEVTSVTGYGENAYQTSHDSTATFGPFLSIPGLGLSPGDRVQALTDYYTDKFTQEVRLNSKAGARVEWLSGLFYDREKNSGETLIGAVSPSGSATGSPPFYGVFIGASEPSTFQEKAVFASLTYHFTDQFDAQVGARYSHVAESYTPTGGGILTGPTRTLSATSAEDSTTWQFTPRYHFSNDLMGYLRVATGFRPGGPNSPFPGTPTFYKADTTVDYELGLKQMLLEHRLTIDASLFWIDWRDPQITEVQAASQVAFFTNGSQARSRGLNLEAAYIPWKGMTVSGNVAVTDAVLTEALPAATDAFAQAGDRIPYVARFTGYLSAEQRFQLPNDFTPFVAAAVTYVGNRYADFAAAAAIPRFDLPSYTTLDLRAGVYVGNWTARLVVRNLTDERGWVSGLLNVSTDPSAGSTVSVIQPRTVGISAAYKF